MNRRNRVTAALLGLWLLTVAGARAQPSDENHPELKWFSIETEHFFVHFHDGTERTARLVAKIAEEIYEPVTSLYDYKQDKKFHFIIRDHDDYSNGAAFYYDNKIEIWATPMDFELRGTHNWLRNVVTHEFTHMISLQSAMKITQRIPAFYFQGIGYEEERRVDVLRGGPNVIVSYPIAMMVAPAWFAEGVAQYQVPGLGYDTWDTHRDMILRTATLDNRLLTYNEMGVFGKNSLDNEKVYNHGFAFVSYLVGRYGLETLRKVTHNLKGAFRLTLDGALKKATGKSGKELYREWVQLLQTRYAYQTREILRNRVEGEVIERDGQANFHPEWSPRGNAIAYLTNRGQDYLSQTSLVVRDLEKGRTRTIRGGVHFAFSWSPDGTRLAFADKSARGKGGSHYYDLYIIDLERHDKKRLTHGRRAHSPHWSPDGQRLVFIFAKDGTENLGILDLNSGGIEPLTHYAHGEQLYKPRWAPDGRSILFGRSIGRGRNLYLLDLASRNVTPVVEDEHDARDAVFSPDGTRIYFSWDRTGIFNIYSLDLATGKTTQWTNVVGGAFMPAVNDRGELLFSQFGSDGYKIARLRRPQPLNADQTKYLTYRNGVQMASAEQGPVPASVAAIGHKQYNDREVPEFEAKPYRSHYAPVAFLPRVMLDYGTLKLGTYVYSSDVLDKYGFIAGFDVNRFGDYDLFALLEFRKLGPTLFLEGYNQVQNTSVPVDSIELIRRGLFKPTSDRFRYNLLEVNLGARFKLSDYWRLRTAFVFSRYGARVKFKESFGETSFGYTYFIGRDFTARLTFEKRRAYRHSEINPVGRYFALEYTLAFDKFLQGFEIDNRFVDGIGEVFAPYNYHRVTLDLREGLPLPIKNHTLAFDLRAGFISEEVDDFLHFFGGGLFGNRGYPYFSIQGSRLVTTRFTYRLPLFSHLDLRFLHLYLDKVFIGAFFDYSDGFTGKPRLSSFKRSAGFQVRMDTFSFYAFPTRFFFDAAYGFDEFSNAGQRYGKEWRFYFGLSFGYLD